MIHLIDKDTLVAEIERMKADALQKKEQCKRSGLERIVHQIGAYNNILSLINTLDVKDVDLEKEPASEDLEQASRNYADDEEYGDDVHFSIKATFKAGAQWQKEQILKDAEQIRFDCSLPCKTFNNLKAKGVEIGDKLFIVRK